ncbi:MAG: hypothetical protein ABIP75_15620 [Pyrinomonadaceae bacterium]
MKIYLALAALSLCCFLIGCNKTGTPTEYTNACSEANDKKYIEVAGFLDDKGGIFCSNTGGGPVRCGFKLLQNSGDPKGFSADIEIGTGANSVEKITGSYKREDIKIHDNSGNVINLADKYRVTGKLNFAKDPTAKTGDVCYLTVTKIEK